MPEPKGKSTLSNRTLKITQTAVLAALALVIGFAESLLPPVTFLPPGAKPGFSNVVTMYAAGSLGGSSALSIALIKGVFAFLTRGVTAGLMSLAGGIFSTLVMLLAFRFGKHSGLIGIGISGAITHNLSQLLVATFLAGTTMLAYLPWLLTLGIVTGTVTGFVLKAVCPAVNKAMSAMKRHL